MMEMVVATRNTGKLKEIRRLLESRGIRVRGLEEFPGVPDVVEDGQTFAENAIKKAEAVAQFTSLPCLADDSGLVVDALQGRPGVHSARFSGAEADDQSNNRKLLDEMATVPEIQRQAAFCCVMALCMPGQSPRLFQGRVNGVILERQKGDGGFGYDPLFWLPGYNCTMAELPLDTKNQVSHRGQALRQLVDFLTTLPA
ncbi:MAG: XTP/dITP diphosphatase [Deltaproteobacteria bacterium]|nr:XTP/dITP diphosphatase [Deltaproteobacteria bacterium]